MRDASRRAAIPVLLILGLSPAVASAEEPADSSAAAQSATVAFPGSFWASGGYVSPVEKGNFVSTNFIEQGFTLVKRGRHAVVPYVSLAIGADQKGFSWNNKAVSQAGVRYQLTLGPGLVQAGAGYAHERRFEGGSSAGQPIAFANYWFGWNRPLAGRTQGFLSSLPGSSWGSAGNQAPAEGNNVIATLFVQQGVTLATFGRFAVIPFIEQTLSVDSADRPWNNRRILGEGVKLRAAAGGGVIEAAASYKHEYRWMTRQSASGLTATVSLWYGWSPARPVRGE